MSRRKGMTPNEEHAYHLEMIARGCREGNAYALAEARRMLASKLMRVALEGIREHAEQEIEDWAAEVAAGGEIDATELRRWNAVIAALAEAKGEGR